MATTYRIIYNHVMYPSLCKSR